MPATKPAAPPLWLILALALVLAPHAMVLPFWISLSWLAFALAAQHPRAWPGWLKILLSLAGMAGVLLQYGTVIGPQGGVALLSFLSGAKLLETHTARDRQGLLFVGCFLLVAYFLNAQSLTMAAYMVIAAGALIAAMVANTQPAPKLPAAFGMASRLLLQALPLALVLFVLFPRLQGPLWGLPQQGAAQTGLSDRMNPGDFGQLTLSDEIAFRVEFTSQPPPANALYWRGPVLWDFDGRSWQTRLALAPNPVRGESRGEPISYAITLEPHHQRWLFLLGLPHDLPPRLPARETVLGSDLQWLSKSPIAQRVRYAIDADLNFRLDAPGLSPALLARSLALPEGNPSARSLAGLWAEQHKTPQAIVNQALAHFRNEAYFYSLKPPLLGADSVDDFLFISRKGFCEHYASSFVFLMRAAGVPARVVTGYQGGERNPLGDYWIVRQRDAHAWAEVWLPEQGWMRVDPTAAVAPERVEIGLDAALAGLPVGERRSGLMSLQASWLMPLRLGWDLINNQWNQWVLGYNQDRQRQLLARLNPFLATWQGMAWGLAAAGGTLLLLMAILAAPRLARRKLDPVNWLYARYCQRLRGCGIERGNAEGPADFARRAAGLRPDLAEPIKQISLLYLALRYGKANGEANGASKPDTLADFKRQIVAFRPARRPDRR